MHEAGDAVKNVTAGEKAAEDLRIATMNPLAAELPSVLALNDREIVANIVAPEDFVNRGF